MSNYTYKSLANILAYIAIILVGIALVVKSIIGGGQIASILKTTADCIAYFMLALPSYAYARSRRNIAFLIIWVIAITLIVVSYFF